MEPKAHDNAFILDFGDLTPRELVVPIGPKRHVLTEATHGAVCQYRNACLRSARMEDGKVSGMEGLADAEPLLVSLCLFELGEGDKRTPVSLATIRSWPNRVTAALFERLKAMSGLDEDKWKGAGDSAVRGNTSAPPLDNGEAHGDSSKNSPVATTV